jgi:Type IV secretion system pilin
MYRSVIRAATVFTAAILAAAAAAAAAPAVAAAPLPVAAPHDLPTIIHNLTVWLVGILAGVATLFLTVGGVRYLMAGGDPAEVERAKSALKSAGIGYALAVLAPVLLQILRSIIGG